MADPISNKGFGDAALAERVMEVYAENENIYGLGREFSDLGIESVLAVKLWDALTLESWSQFSFSAYGIVDDQEATELEKVGFSREFVRTLRGDDGAKALRNRVLRLADRAEAKWWRWGAKAFFLRYDVLRGIEKLSLDGRVRVAGDILPTLVRLLQEDPDPHTSPSISELAAKAIGSLGPASARAVEAVISAAQSGKLDIVNALSVLARISSRPDIAIPYVLYVHKKFGADEKVMDEVRGTLIAFQDRAIPWLLEKMEEENSPSRTICEEAFAFLRSDWEGKDATTRNLLREAASRIVPKYIELHRNSPGYFYGEILRQFGPYAVKLLIRRLPFDPPNARYNAFQQKIINTLSNMGGPAVPELVKVLRKQRLQNFATAPSFLWPLYAFQHMGNRGNMAQAIPEILFWLESPNWNLRWQAIHTLVEIGIGSPEIISALISSLEDKWVRSLALEALEKLAPGQPNAHLALPLLAEIRDNPTEDEALRALAHAAIQRIESGVL